MLKNSPGQPNREGDLCSMMCINIEKKEYQETYGVLIVAIEIIKMSISVWKHYTTQK